MRKLLLIVFLLVFYSLPVSAELNLTKAEQEWIKENPVVKFTGDPNWLPYEAFDDNGNYIGIVAEHLKIISEHTGLKFEMSPSKTWTESVNKARSREVDVLSETDDSDLKSHLDFTIPYVSNPIVIVMRNSENYVENINAIKDKKIALIKDYGYASKIRRKYSNISFITVDDIHDGLISVSTGKVDALLCTLALCSYTISELGLNNVKIIGKSEFDTKLALGVQKNLPLLRSILSKSIKTISPEQQQTILKHWIKDKHEHPTDYGFVIKVVIIPLILLFVFIFWNRRLSYEINLRHRAEKELQQERDYATSIMNTAPVIVLLINPAGEIEYVNPYFEKISGFRLDEIKGKEWVATFLPKRDHEKIGELLESSLDNNSIQANVNSIVTRGGEERVIEWHAETMTDASGKVTGVLSIGQDITERKQAEDKLRSQAKIIDQIHDSVVSIDLDGFITSWNKGGDIVFGYTEDEVLGIHVSSLYPESEHQRLENEIIPVLVKNGSSEIEVPLLNKSGDVFLGHVSLSMLYDDEKNPVGMIGYTFDISESKKSRDALETSEERYRALAKVSPVGIFRTLSTGECIYVNERWCELAGMTEEQAYKNGWANALHPDDRERVFAEWGKSVEDNRTFQTECRFERPDGQATWLLAVAEAERDADNNIVGYVGAVTDISERKSIELSLLDSESLLEKAQLIAKIGHWKLNPATGEVTGSDELFRIFGFPPEEASIDTFVEVVHPDDREMDVAAIQRGVEHGESWDIEHRLICRDGTEKWVHAIGEASKDENGKVIELLGTVQDITREKLNEIELEQSSLRFKAMFESIPDAIVYADPERKIRMVNTASIELFGFDEIEMHGHQTKMLYASHDDFKQQGVKRFNPDTKKSNTSNIITYMKKDGSEFPGETFGSAVKTSSGEVLGYLGVIRDVSDREHVDAILRSLAAGTAEVDFSSFMNDVLERLTELYDCKYAFIGQLQTGGKRIKTVAVRVNGNPADNFEYQLDGTPCKDILDLNTEIIPKNACKLYPNDQMLLDMKVDSYYGAPLISSDGKVFGILSVMDTKEMILDEWSEPVLGVFAKRVSLEMERDMANQKLQNYQDALEEQVKIRTIDLVAARNEAERANEAKSDFLSSMSHELRTPLNAILGFGQMLDINNSGLSNVQQSNVGEILEAGQHLLELINEVLDLAHIESGKLDVDLVKVDLSLLLNECIRLMQSSIDARNIEVIDNISQLKYSVQADFLRLKQIFLNLISNAVKYNKTSGCLTFDSQEIKNNRLRILIRDTGEGLTEDEISRLFNPFDRLNVKHNIEGTGIGLTITKHLIELMDGSIGVESTPGKGSTFWVEIALS